MAQQASLERTVLDWLSLYYPASMPPSVLPRSDSSPSPPQLSEEPSPQIKFNLQAGLKLPHINVSVIDDNKDITILIRIKVVLYAEQKKRHRFIEQSFRLYGRRRGWDVSREQHRNIYTIKGETDHQPRLDA